MVRLFSCGQGAVDNDQLCALVRRLAGEIPGKRPGIRQGWTGPKTLFELPETQTLQRFIRDCLPSFQAWLLAGWGNLLESGDVMEWHDHTYQTNAWSGVYFPHHGGGVIEFERGECFQPEASRMLVFPSALKHRVSATAERISIAFNART
jgi:hypothetical protein